MSARDLPEWVWCLVEELQQYEDEHPKLFRESINVGEYVPTSCIGPVVQQVVPAEIREMAAVMRARRNRPSP